MDRKTKWRTFWLGLLTVLAVLTLVPSLTSNTPIWFQKIFNKKVQLGLDLQGGFHIVYSINLQKAVEDKATEIKRDLEVQIDDAKGDQIEAKISSAPDLLGGVNVTLTAKDEAKRKKDLEKIQSFLKDYDDVVVSRTCPGVEKQEGRKCYRVASDYADRIKKSALEQAIRTIRDRIDEKGIAEPTVISKGDQIVVELPGIQEEDIEPTKSLIARTARLEFRMVVHNHAYMQKLYTHVDKDPEAKARGISAHIDIWRQQDKPDPFYDYYLTAPDKTKSFSVKDAKDRGCWNRNSKEIGGQVECTVQGRAIIDEYIKDLGAEYAAPEGFEIVYEFNRAATSSDEEAKDEWRSYLLEREVQLGGNSVQKAQVFWNPTTQAPEVLINFNRWGGKRFGDMTAAHIGHKMAIILDGKINSAPVIQGAIRGGSSTITMGARSAQKAQKEAEDLVSVLRTGSLPAPLVEESSSIVGPLLGRDAIRKTQFSFMLGSLLVVLIMIWIYRTSGVISIIALILNLLFMMAVLATFGATLTLPGIAALVLTVGMAVDANIIIYERIREELRLGKSVRGAVDAGFSRGFAAIFDGQLTTGIAGYVLYQYGSGPIRGFAVMLIIGITCTLFTATWCTRLFFEYYVGRGRKNVTLGI